MAKNHFHHVGILVKNISEAVDKYASALGIEKDKVSVEVMSYVSGKGETEEFKYVLLPLAKGENNFIELVEPITSGPTARRLEKHGEGLFHLAFESSDISETIREFEKAGIPQSWRNTYRGGSLSFLPPKVRTRSFVTGRRERHL